MRKLVLRRACTLICLSIVVCAVPRLLAQSSSSENPPLLLRFPTISKTQIVFTYGDDLWIVSREGGEARHLTSGIGIEDLPAFSPDGTLVAFTGEYDGNRDVYVVPAAGHASRLCAASAVAGGMEALSRRSDLTHLDCRLERLERGESSAREL